MIEYKSTDVGAVQITNTNSGILPVIHSVLSTGYGSKPGAGWTRVFTGTNLACYKQGAGGNNRVIRFFDGGLQNNLQARCLKYRAYESMSGVSTGVNPFPTTGQVSGNGQNLGYRHVDNISSPPWIIYASSSFFFMIINFYDGADNYATRNWWEVCGFGTFQSEKPGDTFNQVIIGSAQQSNPDYSWVGLCGVPGITSTNTYGIYVERSDTGVAGSKDAHLVNRTGSYIGSSNETYPSRPSSSLIQAKPQLWCDGFHRGYIPGLWETFHSYSALGGDQTTWDGNAGTLAGKSFKQYTQLSSQYNGQGTIVVETSDTW